MLFYFYQNVDFKIYETVFRLSEARFRERK